MGFDIIIFVAAALICALITFLEIPVLKRLHAGQNIREEGPQEHLKKAGTPTMGGFAYIIALIIVGAYIAFFCHEFSGAIASVVFVLLTTLFYGFIGIYDDYLKVVKHQNEGLSAKHKFILQCVFGVACGVYRYYVCGSSIRIPFARISVDFGWFIVPFTAFVLAAMTNAVNLNDGVDGLCSSVTMNASLCLAIVIAGNITFGIDKNYPSRLMAVALAGCCIGFLVFNAHPAKLFMGDTGSLAIGAYLTAVAMTNGLDLALPIIGIVYVAEVLSDIIQVAVYKKTKKRVFKMAPIHHHFELCGWSEYKVDMVFALVTLAFGIIAIFIF